LWAWEDEFVSECASFPSDVILQDFVLDRWRWIYDPIIGYSVRGTYKHLMVSASPVEHFLPDAVWLKQVSMKVSVFVWRLFCNRLPTQDNLVRRRVLHHDDLACVGGCGSHESEAHLLLECIVFGSLWHHIYQWVDISFIVPKLVFEHLHHFGYLASIP